MHLGIKNMSRYNYILDAGHGGFKNGVYTTDPKKNKKFKFPDGFEIFEGVINRQITKRLYQKMNTYNIDYSLVYDEVEDWSLTKRVNLANKIYSKKPNSIYISIHSNAGNGKGFEIFTSPRQTDSDLVAEIFCDQYKKFSKFPFRPGLEDGDADKEEKFTVLTDTKCPALLIENLFFDNRKEADYLVSDQGQEEIANLMLDCILQVEVKQPI